MTYLSKASFAAMVFFVVAALTCAAHPAGAFVPGSGCEIV